MTDQTPKSRPFTPTQVATRRVDQIAAGLGLYIVLVLLPGYEGLRYLWSEQHTLFELRRCAVALLVAVGFATYARHTMRKYLSLRR